MSSASETHTRTPHSRELSDRTGPTEYSPDILRFKHLSLESCDPFISTPLSPTAPPFRPDGVIDRDTFIRAIPSDPVAFGIVMDMMMKGPRPEPFVDLQLRRHGGSSFAQRDNGEPSTSFVWASGEHHISMYHGHGPFSWALNLKTFVSILSRPNGTGGNEVFIYYRDVRDAEFVVDELRVRGNYQLNPPRLALNVHCCSIEQYCHGSRDQPQPLRPIDLGKTFVTGFDGQLLIQAQLVGKSRDARGLPHPGWVAWAHQKVREFISSFSDIKVMNLSPGSKDPNLMMFHVELHQHLKADEVVDFLNRFPDGWQYNNELLFFGVYFCERAMWKPVGPRLPGQEELHDTLMSFRRRWWGEENYTDQPDPVVRLPQSQDPSPSKFGIIGQQRPMSYDRGFHGRGGMSFDTGSVSSGSRRENKNHVNVDRIRAGTDVRTTIMLRNIPNRIDQPMLKQIVDDTSAGCYDFMYLRIDFTNNCNVGYAFINFQLPEDICCFVENIVGKKWANSDKVAEVSYATMQGRETLVQKFRNSSVMSEAVGSRPKLYYCDGHPLARQEEPFPDPDNNFKLQRSHQNAAHIGLFSPGRGGASYTGFDRHRRGQFDRGTSFAELEELVAENRYLRTVAGLRRSRGGMQAY